MRKLPLIAGAVLPFAVPLFGQQRGAAPLRRDGDVELFEYVCQQMNYAHELMVGSNDSVDRRSPMVP